MLEPHVERMVTELDELAAKTSSLCTFIETSAIYPQLPAIEREAMRSQLAFMVGYRDVLANRIRRATSKGD